MRTLFAAVCILVVIVASVDTARADSLSDELRQAADEAYPALIAHCDAIVTNATRFIIENLRRNAELGLDSYITLFQLSTARCGRDRDQLKLITARLCDPANDLIVTCDPTNVTTQRVLVGDEERDEKVFKFAVELRRNIGATCACVAPPLDLPRRPVRTDDES